MILSSCAAGAVVGMMLALSQAHAEESTFPQTMRLRYEANDAKGGNFIIWVDREKFWHGLDQRLYPAARYVEIRHITPSTGSPPITIVEVGSVSSPTPEYYHAAGLIRFKITNMSLKSTNVPN
jgi:hypothetical protein